MLGGGAYLFGVIFFIFAIPERWTKKTFDVIGNSHSIFHICVVAGAAILFDASMDIFLARQSFICPLKETEF
jgi:adiponectin receptor